MSNDDQPNWNYPTISLNILQVTTFQTWHSDVDHAIQTLFDVVFVLFLFIGLSLSFLLLFLELSLFSFVVVCCFACPYPLILGPPAGALAGPPQDHSFTLCKCALYKSVQLPLQVFNPLAADL